jgi:hypothetical protein
VIGKCFLQIQIQVAAHSQLAQLQVNPYAQITFQALQRIAHQ